MRSNRFFAHTLTRFAMISPLLLVRCRTQSPSQSRTEVPALPAEVPGTADRYSVLMMGNPAGQQAVWTAPDGQLHIFFQFNDRGRGPQTTSVLKLDAKGVPVAENISGNNYYKSPVRENYSIETGTAHWKSNIEQGEKQLSTPAVYLSTNGAPAELGLLARVALGNAGRVALLPEGEATINQVTGLSLESAGRKKNV